MPLHWSTEVTSWLDVVTVVVQPEGGSTPAAARHAVAVTVEVVTPWAETAFSIVMVQVTSNPAPVGKAGGSHWVTAGAVAAATVKRNPGVRPARTEEGLIGVEAATVTTRSTDVGRDESATRVTAGALSAKAALGRTSHVTKTPLTIAVVPITARAKADRRRRRPAPSKHFTMS
jgi:voltage-gated potassium channel Kch